MGKIEDEVEKVKQRQWSEEHNKDSAYWKEKARLIKQKEVKEQKEKARESFAPTPQQAAGAPKSFTQKATGFIKERSIAIAHESRDLGTRRQNYGGGIPMTHHDPFGVGSVGSVNPFAQRSEPAPRPRKRAKRRKAAPAPRRRPAPRQSSGGGMDMMGIPKHMRWMF